MLAHELMNKNGTSPLFGARVTDGRPDNKQNCCRTGEECMLEKRFELLSRGCQKE